MLQLCPSSRRRVGGFTFIDVMMAVLVVGLAFGGVFAANSRALSLVKSAKQAAVASKCLQQRIEQIRNYNWTQITDAAAMQDLYSVPPLPSIELPGFSEQCTISAFTPATSGSASNTPSGTTLTITRDNAGVVTLVSDNPALMSGALARVDVRITWPGPSGTQRLRETSVIIGNGGIGR
jgi:Tfp pilus assembly protein PilV